MTDKKHMCDLRDPKRLGRAHYICKECGKDITLELVYLYMGLENNDNQEKSDDGDS